MLPRRFYASSTVICIERGRGAGKREGGGCKIVQVFYDTTSTTVNYRLLHRLLWTNQMKRHCDGQLGKSISHVAMETSQRGPSWFLVTNVGRFNNGISADIFVFKLPQFWWIFCQFFIWKRRKEESSRKWAYFLFSCWLERSIWAVFILKQWTEFDEKVVLVALLSTFLSGNFTLVPMRNAIIMKSPMKTWINSERTIKEAIRNRRRHGRSISIHWISSQVFT